MGAIILLENNVINKIAAGEVVERPASVVKELLENAVDAAAAAVTVEIKDGGTSYIRVTDNGCGIPKSEVKTAFLRHATSKIRDMDDLENVLSLGFRGEALSSIASVARVEMVTKQYDAASGCRAEIENGAIRVSDIGCADGTSVIVRDLFFNTPARLKFMKKPAAEGAAVSELINRAALMHPRISLKYIADGRVVLQAGGRDLKTSVLHVYGRDIADKLLEVGYEKEGVTLTGFAGRPEIARGNRGYEHFYVNGRYIKCELANAAVENLYKTRLPAGRFPFYVLHMRMPPSDVDVNVHPAKLEARFKNEEAVYNHITAAVSGAFTDINLIPKTAFSRREAPGRADPPVGRNDKNISPADKGLNKPNIKNDKKTGRTTAVDDLRETPYPRPQFVRESGAELKSTGAIYSETGTIPYISKSYQAQTEPKPAMSEIESRVWPLIDCRVVGQVFLTYWIIETNDSIYLLDQHAAHERITYERILSSLKEQTVVSQILLTPVALDLTPAETAVLKDNFDIFTRSGFEIDPIGENKYALRGVPFVFDANADAAFFLQILDSLKTIDAKTGFADFKFEKIAVHACKASVKGNERIGAAEAKALADDLSRAENPFTCPHGRPTLIEITRRELEKRFLRA